MLKQYPRYLMLILILLLLSACGTNTPEATSNDAETAESNDSRTVLHFPHPLYYNGKESLDPASPVDFTLANVILYNRLVRMGEDGLLVPELATNWTANEDATEWTFTLRDDVTFHNGQPLTSADVAYTIEHILNPELQSPTASTLKLITKVETPDEHTVVFKLAQAHADFPLLLVARFVGIIPEGSADTIAKTGIGTGPFKLETLDASGITVLSANDNYWKGKPKLAGIEITGLAGSESRVLAAQSGQIDLLFNMTSSQANLFTNDDNFNIKSYSSGQFIGLVMLTDTPPFDDVRVRQAMRLVADRQAMADLVLSGAGVVSCDTPVAPTDAYRLNSDCPQDIEQAKKLLAEAGYPNGLDVTLYASDSSPQDIPLAEVYQQQAAAAGINVKLEIAPADSYFSEVWMVKPFCVSQWQERSADQILNEAWRADASWNESRFNNPEYERLLDDARKTLDFETRRKIYQDAQQLLFEQSGTLIPFHFNEFIVMKKKVSGVPAMNLQNIEWDKISKNE